MGPTYEERQCAEHAAERAVLVLNRALQEDPEAVRALFKMRVLCNEVIAHDPTIQVRRFDGGHDLSPLGLINGLIGIREDGWGYIEAIFETDTGNVLNFKVRRHGTP